ncbi:kinesin-like protein KIF20A isoform X1 [Polypterus senegalus]|uniref:kinesin-like protein KIF20A isoform X1 n=1 Tax=Polypterus senegalus TaxID=55291 RepID=UPI0019627002|nr:kinesin-like protein KIF20A isoform X1 [Polypterus senegalus]XP_039629742.1 kinesin-like protein KIF20A isoform X1 [Polypterus senegalus]
MAVTLPSPRGFFSDEEEAPVFESTAADMPSGICKGLLSEFSVISPGADNLHEHKGPEASPEDGSEKVKVYLRIRPFTDSELEKGEEQACVSCESSQTLLLKAPRDSFTMKNTERGVGQSLHKFTFSQIFGPETSQKKFFNDTMKEVVKNVLDGENRLIYTYGITNSGKTYTIQGTAHDGGILPRSLSTIFNTLKGKLYDKMDRKPSLCNDVVCLTYKQIQEEEMKKWSFLREDEQTPLKDSSFRSRLGTSVSFDSGIGGVSAMGSHFDDSESRYADVETVPLAKKSGVRYSLWVSFFEIYNEFIYDLLDMNSSKQKGKRQTLRLCDDKYGNPYVRDLNWINVSSAEEAWKVLKVGRRNQSFASTHLNQNSSRSHSIFSVRVLHLNDEQPDATPLISELSLCDLAGSERCKEQKCGDRLKEANNINTSLHMLGRCIAALRQNQQQKTKQVVPFRDSKLTRVFQGFFCGRGKSCMIVNINQCASMYDETLHALKFSAIATQLIHSLPSKSRVAYIQSLLKEQGLRTSEGTAEIDESCDESVDCDDSVYPDAEALLNAVEILQDKLIRERQEKESLESRIRDEVFNEMMEHINERERQFSEMLENERELLEHRYEAKMENLQTSWRNYYLQKIEEHEEQIKELQSLQEDHHGDQLDQSAVSEGGMRRSKRLASQQEALAHCREDLSKTKAELLLRMTELQDKSKELQRYQDLVSLPPSASMLTSAVDRKLEEGQKSIRLLRSELQKLGEWLQSAERACCRNANAEKLRQTLGTCDEILSKQDQTLAELQNNMTLVKMDLRKKTVCIAEQFNTVQTLKENPPTLCKRRGAANEENLQPQKKPFLRSLFNKTPTRPVLGANSPYASILRSRQRTPAPVTPKYRPKY